MPCATGQPKYYIGIPSINISSGTLVLDALWEGNCRFSRNDRIGRCGDQNRKWGLLP